MRTLLSAPFAALFLAALSSPSRGAWPLDTSLPVCTAPGNQSYSTAVPDGSGGVLVFWNDSRSDVNDDVYAQHVSASGVVDPAWPVNGRAVCALPGTQAWPAAISDGAGGAIVVWHDGREGGWFDIYAQHLLASGAIDPAWPLDGRALCTAANSQSLPRIVADGAGGAIVVWEDERTGFIQRDVYAQHVLPDGTVDPLWPPDGVALCIQPYIQDGQRIVPDGAGGAIVAWRDQRTRDRFDIYAQRVLASGVVDPAWPENGRLMSEDESDKGGVDLIPDSQGGALVTWTNGLGGGFESILVQHLLSSGVVDPAWPHGGRGVVTPSNLKRYPAITSDGAGGAIVAWQDRRWTERTDIYAHHVLPSGALDPAWPFDGRNLCWAPGEHLYPIILADGAGGAIVGWIDGRAATAYDIYAQHVLPGGAVDPDWPIDGRAVTTAMGSDVSPAIVSNDADGAILAWTGAGEHYTSDLFAQRLARHGFLGTPEPELQSLSDVPDDQGGAVTLSWNASYLEFPPYDLVTRYDVFRSVAPGAPQAASGWEYVASVDAALAPGYSHVAPTTRDSSAAGAPLTAFMVQARTSGSRHWESLPMAGYSVDNLAPATPSSFAGRYDSGTATLHWDPNGEADLAGYRLYRGATSSFVPGPSNLVATLTVTGYVDDAGQPAWYKLTAVDTHDNPSPPGTVFPDGAVGVPDVAAAALWLSPPEPNPASDATTLRFSLAREGIVRLSVYDAGGRRIRTLVEGMRAAGGHAASWDLCDGRGRTVGAGLYFPRLEVEDRVLVRRLAVTR